MPPTRLVLDPDGYKYSVEEGAPYSFDGAEIFQLFGPQGAAVGTAWWNPQGSKYLLPIPRQFDARWYADSRLSDHVLTYNLWTWAGGLAVTEWNPPRTVNEAIFGTSTPADKWIVGYVPAAIASLDTCNYTALGQAAGISLGNMRTVGKCNTTPVGAPLGAGGVNSHFTPFIQVVRYPAPYDTLAFGFSNLCLLFAGDKIHLLRSPNNDKQTWKQLGVWERFNYPTGFSVRNQRLQQSRQSGGPAMEIGRGEASSILVAEVGDNELYLVMGNGQSAGVPLASTGGLGVFQDLLPPGAWWLGAALGQKFVTQVQVVGYEAVNSAGNRPLFFQIPYKPTQAPDFRPVFVMHMASPTGFTVGSSPAGTTLTSDTSGEEIVYQLLVHPGTDAWVSDGTHDAGTVFLSLIPRTPGGLAGAYLTPSIREFPILFPPLLADRVNNRKVLTDEQFDDLIVEVSRDEPAGARFLVNLREEAETPLTTAGFSERFGFPIHWEENTGTEALPVWTLRAAAWVDTINLEEPVVERLAYSGHGAQPVTRAFTIQARGLLVRADRPFLVPHVVDPDGGGKVSYLFAITQTLKQAHFNTADAARVKIHPDPDTGSPYYYLPGTPDTEEGRTEAGGQQKAWDPGAKERMLRYLQRVSEEWAGRVLFSTLTGRVWSAPDILEELETGKASFFSSFTLYKNHQSATGAGRPPAQVYRVTGREVIPPRANVVIIRGQMTDGQGALKDESWTETDALALSDINYVNFAGEPLLDVYSPRLALGEKAGQALAKRRLTRVKRKRILRRFRVDTAPWLLELNTAAGDGCQADVGYGFTAQDRGNYIVRHIRLQLRSRDVYQMDIQGERIPSGGAVEALPGEYPGLGIEEEEEP